MIVYYVTVYRRATDYRTVITRFSRSSRFFLCPSSLSLFLSVFPLSNVKNRPVIWILPFLSFRSLFFSFFYFFFRYHEFLEARVRVEPSIVRFNVSEPEEKRRRRGMKNLNTNENQFSRPVTSMHERVRARAACKIGFVRSNICIRFVCRVMHFNLTFVSFHL